ncbi:MAG: 23S rRNA pseudouridine1911/1915/1917 synthase, partial [Dinoroseobacter sp.]
NELVSALHSFPRQALHARRLSFVHPSSGEECEFESALPDDMAELLMLMRQYASA